MKKRLAITVAAFGLVISAALASPSVGASARSTWGCAGNEQLDVGVCVNDPIPHPLPTVDAPAPALPTS